MTLRNLQVFIKVAECGKMNVAAKQLYVSQSSISQAISEIEREYNVVLFDRVGKQLHITPLGEQLLEFARKAVAYQESIEEWLRQSSSKKSIRAGATMTVGASIFSTLLKRLRERCPGVEISAFVGNTELVEEKLLRGELDIGLVEGSITNPHISSRVVMDDHLVLVCGREHRFYARPSVSIRELEGEALLLREHGSGTRAQIVEKLEEYGVACKVAWESCSTEAIKQGVIDGHGISVLSQRLVSAEVKYGTIWACRIEEFPIYRHFSLAVYSNRVETHTMALFSEIADELAKMEQDGKAQ